jgi:glutamate racemase
MKIGIFDSGLGGLTIYRAIHQCLPQYDYVYLGDNARAPYGNRSFDAIFRFTGEAVHYLFGQQCQLIVIACNTASAKALRNIQQQILPGLYPGKRVLGVIRPSAEALQQLTRTGSVALWATEGTVKSNSYPLEIEKLAPGIRLWQQACPLLVPMVEAGEVGGPAVEYIVGRYWKTTQELAPDIDALLLACTHYPILLPVIRARLPPGVRVLEQGSIVAPSLRDYLDRHPEIEGTLSRGGVTTFLTTDQSEGFDRLAQTFLGKAVRSSEVDLRRPLGA